MLLSLFSNGIVLFIYLLNIWFRIPIFLIMGCLYILTAFIVLYLIISKPQYIRSKYIFFKHLFPSKNLSVYSALIRKEFGFLRTIIPDLFRLPLYISIPTLCCFQSFSNNIPLQYLGLIIGLSLIFLCNYGAVYIFIQNIYQEQQNNLSYLYKLCNQKNLLLLLFKIIPALSLSIISILLSCILAVVIKPSIMIPIVGGILLICLISTFCSFLCAFLLTAGGKCVREHKATQKIVFACSLIVHVSLCFFLVV